MYNFPRFLVFLLKSKMAVGGHFVYALNTPPFYCFSYVSNEKIFTKIGQTKSKKHLILRPIVARFSMDSYFRSCDPILKKTFFYLQGVAWPIAFIIYDKNRRKLGNFHKYMRETSSIKQHFSERSGQTDRIYSFLNFNIRVTITKREKANLEAFYSS